MPVPAHPTALPPRIRRALCGALLLACALAQASSPPPAPTPPGVVLAGVQVEGTRSLSDAELAEALGPVEGLHFDLAGLEALASRVQQRVREAGFPLAQAWLPADNLRGGILRIVVDPGRYGQVRTNGDAADVARPWLADIRPGDAITLRSLEETLGRLQSQAGMQVAWQFRPGQAPGDADLYVQAERQRQLHGEFGADNHGTRQTGRERLHASLDADSAFLPADQLALKGQASAHGTWLGSASYSVPAGLPGARASMAAARTAYTLGGDFDVLQAWGTAETISASVRWPLLWSPLGGVDASLGWQRTRLHEAMDALEFGNTRHSQAVSISVAATHRTPRSTSGAAASLNFGRLALDDDAAMEDGFTAGTQGHFTRLNLDLARLQSLSGPWQGSIRLAGQWTDSNLDPSEKFALGGPATVRAWPVGETSGDTGWLTQLELRYRQDGWEPYAFFDAGAVRFNRRPFTTASNHRQLHGAGFGLRTAMGNWIADASLGWRGGNAPSASDPSSGARQLWVSVGYRL